MLSLRMALRSTLERFEIFPDITRVHDYLPNSDFHYTK